MDAEAVSARPVELPSREDVLRAIARLAMARRDAGRGAIRSHRDGRIYVDFGHDFRVWYFPLGDRTIRLTRELADHVLRHVREELKRGRPIEGILAEFQPDRARVNLVTTCLERWLDVKRRETASGDRSPGYLRELERWARPGGHFAFWRDLGVRDVHAASLEDWSLWLCDRRTPRGAPLAPATRARVLGGFHAFLVWLWKRGELRELPRAYPWPKVPEREPRVLAFEDQAAVLEAIALPDRGIFLACALMGLRPSEARALEIADYRDGALVIEKKCSGPNVGAPVRAGTKSGKARTLPVAPAVAAWIEAHVPREGRLERRRLFVVSSTGRPWSQWTLIDRWRAACRVVGVVGVAPYTGTRHSFATDAVARGVEDRDLQAYLGHADGKTTRRYGRITAPALRRVPRIGKP